MTPTQKAALDQLIAWGFSQGFYSYDDVSAQVTILEGTPVWDGQWDFTQEQIDNGISSQEIQVYILKATIYQSFNIH